MNPAQEQRFRDAIGDGSGLPKITSDPEVNYEIDRVLSECDLPPWSLIPDGVKTSYIEEARILAFFKSGAVLLIFRFSNPTERLV